MLMQPVRNERGSVIVFVTLMVVLLLIMVGLGLDTGQLTYVRNQGQAAVDAAALAAVSGLVVTPKTHDQVVARAAGFNLTNNYVESKTNTIGSSHVSYVKYDYTTNQITYGEPIATANGVRVALEGNANSITTPVFLTPLMNLLGIGASGTKDINVSAVATIITKPAIPIALWSALCPADGVMYPNVEVKFQHPTKTGDGENSCWTTFLDCSSGASDIKALFEVAETCSGSPINGEIAIDVPICQNRGQVNSVLFEAEQFFKAAPDYPNKWWLVPVIGGGGNCDPKNPTKIVNWAKIRPTDFVTTGDPKYIKADVVCGPYLINEGLDTSLCYSHRLIREPGKGY
jgi:Flp pilus assembly protein TadG